MLPPMVEAAAALGPDVVSVVAQAPSLGASVVAGVLRGVAKGNGEPVHSVHRGVRISPLAGAELARISADGCDGQSGAAGSRSETPLVRRGDTYNLLAAADVALVTSGTATLEAALVGCPLVVAYRMSAFSYALARRLVKVPFIAMPNLLLGRRVVPELVQHDADAAHMTSEAGRLLRDASERARMLEDFGEIRRLLARPGAADRAAALALELLP